MSINSWTFILSLFDWIQVSKNNFEIFLILVEERSFDSFSDSIHFLQTHFLLLLIKTIIVQIFNQLPSIFYVKIDFFIVLLSLISDRDLVRNADSFKIFYKITEIDTSCDKVTLWIKTSQILCLWVCVNPCKRNWCSVSFENQAIWVIPKSNTVFIVMNDHLFRTYGVETFNSWSLVNVNVPN